MFELDWKAKCLGLALVLANILSFDLTLAQINCRTSQNTICMARDPVCLAASIAEGVEDSGLRNYIIGLHNTLRSNVAGGREPRGLGLSGTGRQPGSRCIAKLVWMKELADTAQRWADQCKFTSDTLRNLNVSDNFAGGPYVGQNAFGYLEPVGASIGLNRETVYWEEAINSWSNEVSLFNGSQVGSFVFSTTIGHYSQMVWGSTTHIGCGYRRWIYQDGSGRVARIMVCNYWPGGNRPGATVYETFNGATSSPSCSQFSQTACSANMPLTRPSFLNRILVGDLCEIPNSRK